MNEDFFEKHYNSIYKWCLYKTNNIVDAEDLFQDINYQLIKAKSKGIVINDEEKFIHKISYYTWCKKIRQKYNSMTNIALTEELENIIKDDKVDILKQIEFDEIKELLNKHIVNLDEKQKNCIELYYYQDLSIKEIAKALNIKEDLVKYYLYKARKKIRSEYENEKIK